MPGISIESQRPSRRTSRRLDPRFAAQTLPSLPRARVNSGVQVLSHRVLEYIPHGRASDLARDIYAPLVEVEPIMGFPLTGFRVAIDSPEQYREAQEAVATGRYRFFSPGRSPGKAVSF